MSGKPNFLVRLARGTWRTVDLSRRLLVNLLFLLVIFVVIALLMEDKPVALAERTVLVVSPVGNIVEQYTRSPMDQFTDRLFDREVPETRLRDIIDAIAKAKRDPKIDRLLIWPDGVLSVGVSQLQEIARAVDDFKESGKPVHAYSESMLQQHYYLASLADELWLHPEGLVLLEGYDVYRNYFAEALDKLAVNVHLFRVGEYKSAAEPFVRNDMSPESKEANRYWLDGLWDQFLVQVAPRRGMTPEQLEEVVTNYAEHLAAAGGSPAQMAVATGLVDRVADREELSRYLGSEAAWEEDLATFRQLDFDTYNRRPVPTPKLGDQVAVIVAQGPILAGDQPRGAVGGESLSRLIREARADDRVKAIVLRVDSPGGAVIASEKIRGQLAAARAEGTPVVVSMGAVAASGGYWISMAADELIANPGTITGSIGIFGLLTTFPDTLAKIGVYTDGVGTTPLSGALRLDRELQPEVAEIIQMMIEDGYQSFLNKVAEARGMSVEAVDAVARGRVWSGEQALERGLVDSLGGLQDAVYRAAELAEMEDYDLVYWEEPTSPFEQFLLGLDVQLPELGGTRSRLAGLVNRLPTHDLGMVFEGGQGRLNRYAYCFCDMR